MSTSPDQFISNLKLGDNGFLQASTPSEFSYGEGGHEVCHAIEDTSFWFVHRNQALAILITAFPPPQGRPFLDIGGGNGYVAAMIKDLGHRVVLIEPGDAGVRYARERLIEDIVQASLVDLEVEPGSVGAIGLFDVLEHIDDDVAALVRMEQMLAPGGKIYLTVPAHRLLWSSADVQAGHYRRYTRRGLVEVLRKAGLEVEFDSYYFWSLPLPMFVLRCLPERLGLRRGERRADRVPREHERDNRLMKRSLEFERVRFRRKRSIPIGASVLAVAVKA